MSRSILIMRVLLTAAVGLLGLATAAGASGATWASTHTHALNLRGRLLGRTPASARLEISAVLPLRNAAEINRLIEARQILTPAQVRARFSPTGATVRSVAGYLASEGFRNVSVSSNRLLVTGYATVAQAERAFDTTLSSYELGGRSVYANTSAARVPAALSRSVTAVLGLSDVPMNVPNVKTTPSSPQAKAAAAAPQVKGTSAAGSPDLSGFDPQALENAYQAKSLPPASGTEIAVLTSGDMTPTIADLRTAEKAWGYPQVPVAVRYDAPAAGIVTNNPLTGNAEWSLDTQISTEMAHDVKQLDIYDVGTFTDPEVARGINLFVSDDRASALSISLGECDYIAFLDGAMITSDEALAEGALQGQSSFSSTGDNGYACPEGASTGVPEGPPGVSWPSDGEYTAGVGGTTLLADSDGNVSNEIAWIGGGGGSSPWETAPPWTLQAYPVNQSWQYTNQGGRTVPDVSAVADSNTPVLIYAGGSQEGVGGTSVASPLTMGLWSRANNTSGDTFGLAQYDFYDLYNNANPATTVQGPLGPTYVPAANPGPVTGFRDITLGTNGGCVAKAGYDACTGIGVLQTADLAKALAPLAHSGPAAGGGGGSSTSGSPSGTSSGVPGSQPGSAGSSSGSSGARTRSTTGSNPRVREAVITFGRSSARAHGAAVLVDPGLRVSCPSRGARCSVVETATAQVAAASRSRRSTIGRSRFTIPSAGSRELTFKLSGAGAQLLRRLGRLRVRLTIVSRVGRNPTVTTTRTITIRAPKRRR
jgi:hypothetical protein